MLADLHTVVWKEWIEWKRQYNSRSSTILITIGMAGVFAVILPLQFGDGWFHQGQALYAWLSLPVLLLLRTLGDVFAGERERHTLETLLATRLPDAALFLGKMLVPIIWTWFFTQLVMATALIPLNFFFKGGGGFYQPGQLVSGLLLSLLSSLYTAAAGTFLSLRSATVDQANQSMFLFLILFGILVGGVTGIFHFTSPGAGILQMVPCLAGVLMVLDILLIGLIAKTFHRKQLT
jgi:ABC-2 type transport system permease protein